MSGKLGPTSDARLVTEISPGMCVAADCDRLGEALIEQYVPGKTAGNVIYMEPSGNWIWLCGPHVVEEFS